MMRAVPRALAVPALVAVLLPASLLGQANVEEQARRQFESGLEFYRAGRYNEALKDFQTVAEGYATSSVADDAMLAIGSISSRCCATRLRRAPPPRRS